MGTADSASKHLKGPAAGDPPRCVNTSEETRRIRWGKSAPRKSSRPVHRETRTISMTSVGNRHDRSRVLHSPDGDGQAQTRSAVDNHDNILKRLLVYVSGFNLGLLMRRLLGDDDRFTAPINVDTSVCPWHAAIGCCPTGC